MKKLRFMQVGWMLLLAALVLGVSFISPALASNRAARHTNAATAPGTSTTAINTLVYLTLGMLQPQFQQHLDQQVPVTVNSDINSIVGTMPTQDQAWARTMATTLIQPNATLQSLVPRQNGLDMTIQVALYPGDPQPITASILVSFSVLDSSTVQVSTSPLSGPTLSSGPQSTFQVPIGVLTAIKSTPNCGSSALAMNLQIPVSVGQTAATSTQTLAAQASLSGHGNPMAVKLNSNTRDNSSDNTFIEIPASELASLSSSVGNIPVGNNFTAQNMRISVQGQTLQLLSDIYWAGINLGTATTTIVPGASGGNLVMNVTNTSFSLFGLFNFPMNSYNQQIEQILNTKIGNAFAGMFTVATAAIGPNSQLPCAKSDSLVLSGTSTIG
ncbi:MAG TPA: hypothetical protein VNE38_05375 [Ktedonobacteraceae bacterium]|nr:hypothetical protein [Ktedonobacteraceae bacterium]